MESHPREDVASNMLLVAVVGCTVVIVVTQSRDAEYAVSNNSLRVLCVMRNVRKDRLVSMRHYYRILGYSFYHVSSAAHAD